MAIVTDLVTAIESRKFSLSVVYSSVWRKTVWSSMDIWRSSMDDLHGRLSWMTLSSRGGFADQE